MNLLPNDSETIVVSRSAGEVLHLLNKASTEENLVHNQQEHSEKLFVGLVRHQAFEISIRPRRPNSFLPLMVGKVESATSGSIVFVSYQLFPSTRLYLIFWSLFVVVAGIVSTLSVSSIYTTLITIGTLIVIHYIAWANFRMQVRISRDILMKSLA